MARGNRRRGRRRSWAARLRRTCLALGVVGLVVPLLVVLAFRWVPPPTTAFMVRSAQARSDPGWAAAGYRWTAWEDIASHAALAVIAAEDQRFPDHHGFDVDAIRAALEEARQGERLRGASTISQQTAKNLFLWPGRSPVRKGLEAWLTVLVELCWSKQRILEVYLNVAEFGDGLFGITAASERFFGKRPADLGPDEAARLARGPPQPPPGCAPTDPPPTSAIASRGSAARWTCSEASRFVESLAAR